MLDELYSTDSTYTELPEPINADHSSRQTLRVNYKDDATALSLKYDKRE